MVFCSIFSLNLEHSTRIQPSIGEAPSPKETAYLYLLSTDQHPVCIIAADALICFLISYSGYLSNRAIASLTVSGGQDFYFPHSQLFTFFTQILINFSYFVLKHFSFASSFWPSWWVTRPPGKALATSLLCFQNKPNSILFL